MKTIGEELPEIKGRKWQFNGFLRSSEAFTW
jgi:hypothetical protein